LDWALDALEPAVDRIAVNVHHHAEQIAAHLARHSEQGGPTVHLSHEVDRPLGTAGALAALADWLNGSGALVVNADTWHRADLVAFCAGWDGERVRLLTSSPLPFGPGSGVVASIVPWNHVRALVVEPSGLWEVLWREELAAGRLDAVHHEGPVIDCGTPADYLRANLAWSGGESVVGQGAQVLGRVVRSVLWPGATVSAGEVLVDAIRGDGRTVLVR
jgi:NDP-sugar pyrophosphorylase family protein